jgi:hypothetical protein
VTRGIDALAADPAALRSALRELKKAGPEYILRAGLAAGVVEGDSARLDHIQDWIKDGAEALYLGLLEAGELALETGLPLLTLFVFGSDSVRVAVTQTRHQITTLILLPAPKERLRADIPPLSQGGITIIE